MEWSYFVEWRVNAYAVCSSHILNLIVCDGLKEIDSSISKIRVACKFVRSSPSRLATFKRRAEEVSVNSEAMLTLDVPTWWNSTYLMLDVVENFEQTFNHFEYVEAAYVLTLLTSEEGCPKEMDWKLARVFVSFLKVFYAATLSFSGSLHVTTNNFFKKLVTIQKCLHNWRHPLIRKMTTNTQLKFNKFGKVVRLAIFYLWLFFLIHVINLIILSFVLRKLWC